jgi:PAS domain S-box-containing protein
VIAFMSSQRACNLQWFKTTLSCVRDAIVATDSDCRVVLMNPAAERLTGWALPDARGKPLAEVLVLRTAGGPEVVERLSEDFRRCGQVTSIGAAVLRRRDGSEVPIEDSAAPICRDDGTLLGVVVVFHDASARLREEEEKAHLVDDLRRASRAKDEFLAMLGHELRNPLAPLVTTVELLKRKAGDGLARECTVIERQLHHVMRLVNDLMDASRIARGKVEIGRQPVEMAGVVEDAIEMVGPLLQQRGQTVDVSIAPDLQVLGDSERLAQVVANLLHNAAKYSERGSRVALDVAREGPGVVVTVRDHGIGIDRARLAAIFEPFVQAPQALDRADGGLGLGLAVARMLVDLHGGAIAAQSDGPGTGSAFTVRLPALDAAAGPKGSCEAAVAETASAGRRRRVLVVEDNADAAQVLAEALMLLGYEAFTAPDGPHALALAGATHPAIALLDIGLPGMDGYELAHRLRAEGDTEGLRLVALTGYGLAEDRERALAEGFDEHLVKPASLEVLRSVIERLAPALPGT